MECLFQKSILIIELPLLTFNWKRVISICESLREFRNLMSYWATFWAFLRVLIRDWLRVGSWVEFIIFLFFAVEIDGDKWVYMVNSTIISSSWWIVTNGWPWGQGYSVNDIFQASLEMSIELSFTTSWLFLGFQLEYINKLWDLSFGFYIHFNYK